MTYRKSRGTKVEWIEDELCWKFCCANGTGTVDGNPYAVEEQFGIGLKQGGEGTSGLKFDYLTE